MVTKRTPTIDTGGKLLEKFIPDRLGDAALNATYATPATVTAAVAPKLDSAAAATTYAQVFTPEKYGAVGNGVADDTAAVQAAIDAAAAAQGEVLLASGARYRLTRNNNANSACLTVTNGIKAIRGRGTFDTELFLDPATAANATRYYIMRIGTATTGTSNVLFEGFKITANMAAIVGGGSILGIAANHDGDRLAASHNITVRRVSIYDSAVAVGNTKQGGDGAELTTARLNAQFKNWLVDQCYIDTTGNKAVEFSEGRDSAVQNSTMLRCNGGPQAIFASRNIRFQGNYVTYTSNGINVAAGSHDIDIVGNVVEADSSIGVSQNGGALIIRTEPATGVTYDSYNIRSRGNVYRDTYTTLKMSLRIETKPEVAAASYRDFSFNGDTFDGTVYAYERLTAAKATIRNVDFLGCDIKAIDTVSKATSVVTDVTFKNCRFRAGPTINGDLFEISNSRVLGQITVAASANSTVLNGNRSPLAVVNSGSGTQAVNNFTVVDMTDPATLSGLVALFDADTLTAGSITSWAPSAGSQSAALTKVGAGVSPVVSDAAIGAHKAVTLTVTDAQRMTTGAWGATVPNTGFTYITVFAPLSIGAIHNYAAGQASALEPLISSSAANQVMIRAKGSGAGLASPSGSNLLVANTPTAVVASVSGTTGYLYKDKISAYTGTVDAGNDMTGLRIGSSASGNSPYGDMKIAYIAVINRALSTDESSAVMQWLGNRFGITIAA